MNSMSPGTTIHLKGITVKGKNRIQRGGMAWIVRKVHTDGTMLVEAIGKKPPELFWMKILGDPNVKRINGKDERNI